MCTFIIMGNTTSKRDPPPPPTNKEKGTNGNAGHRDFKKNHGLCGLSLEIEEISTNVPEIHSSDEDPDDVFYKFVILHAENDTNEASRLQHLLQNKFCIKPGIIFAEMPGGRHLLENLNDVVNRSAWTIILLTEHFLSEAWCEFQSYTSLMNALNKQHKYNSVIPLRPLNNPLPREKTPCVLQAINALEEDSPGFAKQVEKIFQESKYRQQQAIWRKERTNEIH
ncbi:TIR domain-containing adapter molecule 2 [Emydura macquarii macquarii]|uniref:TIR domain-containing adapter molecule 2 n=1 Tax=Emydura macquarii macquarii TaxID=1129001 RepID=UPI003529EBC5